MSLSGWLYKRDKPLGGIAQDFQEFFFELVGHELFYWTSDSKRSSDLVDVIDIAKCARIVNVSIRDDASNNPAAPEEARAGFQLDILGDSERKVALFAESTQLCKKWMTALKKAQQAHFNLEALTGTQHGGIGDVLKEGWLQVLNSFSTKTTTDTSAPEAWSKYYVRLFGDRVELQSSESKTKNAWVVSLTDEFYVGDSRTNQFAFVLSDYDESIRMKTGDKKDMTSWMGLLARVIRNLGTIVKHQERVLHSSAFPDLASMRSVLASVSEFSDVGTGNEGPISSKSGKKNKKGGNTRPTLQSQQSRPLHTLVKQVSQTQRKGEWASIRADKHKKIEKADAEFREAKERTFRDERNRMADMEGAQKHAIIVAREKLARAKESRHEASVLARKAKVSPVEQARAALMIRLNTLEQELTRSVRKEIDMDMRAREEAADKHRTAVLSATDGDPSNALAQVHAAIAAADAEAAARVEEAREAEAQAKREEAEREEEEAAKLLSKKEAAQRKKLAAKKLKEETARKEREAKEKAKREAATLAKAEADRKAAEKKAVSATSNLTKRKTGNFFTSLTSALLGAPAAENYPTTSSAVTSDVAAADVAQGKVVSIHNPLAATPALAAGGARDKSNVPRKATLQPMSAMMQRVKMWDTKMTQESTFQVADVVQKEVALRPGMDGYGKAPPGSKSEARAIAAQAWVEKEVIKFMEVIKDIGTKDKDTGKITVTFGVLFYAYQDISDTLVGIMKRCKKRNLITYEGDMLFQGLHDHVIVSVI